jgi:hypothetical protein
MADEEHRPAGADSLAALAGTPAADGRPVRRADDIRSAGRNGSVRPPANGAPAARKKRSDGRMSFKLVFALFMITLFTQVDMFVNGFVAHVPNTMRSDGNTTAWGSVIQALTVVVLFALVLEAVLRGWI